MSARRDASSAGRWPQAGIFLEGRIVRAGGKDTQAHIALQPICQVKRHTAEHARRGVVEITPLKSLRRRASRRVTNGWT